MTTSLAITDPIDATPHCLSDTRRREERIIEQAISLLEQRLFQRETALQNPNAVREYLQLKLASKPHEVFAAIFLDTQHRVIAFECLFTGTIDGASVYPREVLKRTLLLNAGALILAHNHPSGVCEPSSADRAITTRLKEALAYIDVRVLDHFIVGDGVPFSFAESGLL